MPRYSATEGNIVLGVNEIKRFVIAEFAPELTMDRLDADYDLLANGVVTSLALLRLIAWIGDRYGIPVEDVELVADDFRTVNAILQFVAEARTVRVLHAV